MGYPLRQGFKINMGNRTSKVSTRVLNQTIKHQPTAHSSRSATNTISEDTKLAERLRSIGDVQTSTPQIHYKPASEDTFTTTLTSRMKLENESLELIEKGGLNQLIPPQTITGILESFKEGDSIELITKRYNLDPKIIPKLKKLGLPPKIQLENELLNKT